MNVDTFSQRIGNLKVLRKIKKGKRKGFSWECKCICGKVVKIGNYDIINKLRTSCGCVGRQRPRIRNQHIENENNINEIRVEEGLTQKALSIAVGISLGHLINITAGYTGPLSKGRPRVWAVKMCEVLEADLSQIWPREVCDMKRGELLQDQRNDILLSEHSLNGVDYKKPHSAIMKALNILTIRQKYILIYRFYMNETLETVGNRFNITRERIRQEESKALRRLRHPTISERLRDVYNIN